MDIYIEHRSPTRSLSRDLARHLYSRSTTGRPVLIVSDSPNTLLSVLRKQWKSTMRQVAVEQSRTLQPARIRVLARLHTRMAIMRFRIIDATDSSNADVMLASKRELTAGMQGTFHTAYILEPLDTALLSTLSKLLDRHALLVIYEPISKLET